MTELDPETKARIEAEERYRAQVRGGVPVGAWLGALAGLVLALSPFAPAFMAEGIGTVNFFVGGNSSAYGLVGLGIVVFLLALVPKTRVVNMFTGFLSLVFTLFLVLGGGFQAFMALNPQYGWIGLFLGAISAMAAGALSGKPD